MTDELTILGASRTGGGSGAGFSYWQRYHECAKRGTLMDSIGGDEPASDSDDLNAADVGALIHKLAEWYALGTLTVRFDLHGGGLPTIAWPPNVALDPNSATVTEALRVFRYYVQFYEPDAFGEVVSVEQAFSFRDADSYSPVGIKPFTGRFDLVTRVSVEQAEALGQRLMMPLQPGIYIVDHKTKASRPSNNTLIEYTERIQFHAYMMAWDTLFADKQGRCNGTIANFMVRHKREPLVDGHSFFQHLVPFPTHDQQQATRHWFQTAQRRKETEGDMHADASHCFTYGRACPFYTSGACKRY